MPTWTKKDYVMVSMVLREVPLDDRLDTKDGDRDILVQAFASRFHKDNPSFDSTRFDAAVFRGEFYKTLREPRRGGWTRQDYEMVADVLKNSIASDAAKAITAQFFADRFYYDNSRFKADLFFRRALGEDFKTRVFHYGPTVEEEADVAWRAKHGFPSPTPLRRHPRRVHVKPYRRAR